MTLDPTFVSNLILVLTSFGGAFLAALWISLVIWTYRDIRTRSRDPLVQTLATLFVAVLNLPGILVYLILRPPHEPWKKNTSGHWRKKHSFRHSRICRYVRAANGASRMTGRSARTAIPSSRRTVKTATGSWNCLGTSAPIAVRPRQGCAGTRPRAWMKRCGG